MCRRVKGAWSRSIQRIHDKFKYVGGVLNHSIVVYLQLPAVHKPH